MSENPEVLPSLEAIASSLDGPAAEVAALGQSVVLRLLSAGLDLNVALTVAGDRAVASRLHNAIIQIDEAVGDLQRLMLVIPGAVAGMSHDGDTDNRGRERRK